MEANKSQEKQNKQYYTLPSIQTIKDNQAKLQNSYDINFMIKLPDQALSQCIKKTTNSSYSRKESVKNSTAKYRQKKKKQIIDLEGQVKKLQSELLSTEQTIQNVKQNILFALQNLAKMNQRSSNQNIEIYHQLESQLNKIDPSKVQQNQSYDFFLDHDKINLLLDTLKYRIGARGRERQSKLVYHFKCIVNTLFPALYRYILFSCIKKQDFFKQKNYVNQINLEWDWSHQLVNIIELQQHQIKLIKQFNMRLYKVFEGTNEGVKKLNQIQESLKEQGQKLEGIQQQLRLILNPAQCAHWTLFAQKYKYRKQLLLDSSFMTFIDKIKSQDDQQQIVKYSKGYKKVKLTKE